MKNIKVIFKGNKSPSGKDTDKEYLISEARLKQLKGFNKFDIEVIDEDKKPIKKKSTKKGAKK